MKAVLNLLLQRVESEGRQLQYDTDSIVKSLDGDFTITLLGFKEIFEVTHTHTNT